ncbi:oligosaccharide flippase family protein [Acidithiobacillus montserratensis]|uniref:Oligosaccharide flippase family protein n=1 Tax=Acidithiobacillus montserratensis TaxID=2729135 RepID=A0ACD5HHR2_9PROT|nr:oligosaccharide flippase family protein [Acidithiobacillus montserratensis]
MVASLKRNSLYNLMGNLAPVVISFVTVPLFLHKIGVDEYGVLAIVWLFLGYFGVFDFGIGMASANQFAKLEDHGQMVSVFWSGIWTNLILGIVGAAVLLLLGDFLFEYLFKMSSVMHASVVSALPWLALAVPVITVNGICVGVLDGRQLFLKMNALAFTGSFFLQLLPLLTAYLHGPDLTWIIAITVLSRLFFGAIPMGIAAFYTLGKPRPEWPQWYWIKKMLGYGGWTTLSNMVVPLTGAMDKFLLGSLVGPAAVTFFAIPERLARQGAVVPGAVTRALFPMLAAGNEKDARDASSQSLDLLLLIQTPMICGLILVLQPFLGIWVGWSVADKAGSVGLIIAATIWLVGLNYIPSMLLQARGRPDIAAKLRVLELLPYLLVLWLSIHYLGLIGGGIGLLFVTILDMLLLFWGAKLVLFKNWTFWQSLAWIMSAEILAWSFDRTSVLWYVFAIVFVGISVVWAGYRSPLIRACVAPLLGRMYGNRLRAVGK